MDRLSRLPPEILLQIGLTLPNQEFVRLLQTNQVIRQVLDTRWMWYRRFVDRIGLGYLEYQVQFEARRRKMECETRKREEQEALKKLDGDGERAGDVEDVNVKAVMEEEERKRMADEKRSRERWEKRMKFEELREIGEEKRRRWEERMGRREEERQTKKDGDGDKVGKVGTVQEERRERMAVREVIERRREVKLECCQFSKPEMRMDRAEMSTKILGGKHRGHYHWATVYGVQPGQRYWVQWGAFIKDRRAFPKSDYRVWISDKHKIATNNPKSSEATPMLIYQLQHTAFRRLGQAGKERTLQSPKTTTLTRIENKNNNIDSANANDNNSKLVDNHSNTRTPSVFEPTILQLPHPLIIPTHCDGDGGGGYENEKTTVTLMARLPLGSARVSYGLVIEYVQLVPAGRGDPRGIEAETENYETECGEGMVQQPQEQEELEDMDEWVDENFFDRKAPKFLSRCGRELNDLVQRLASSNIA
ncbi:hypothetical protein BGZ88_004778 [Linnemannia elongata]|nr:hypothetical protein BGZ88_004778 [Linnemannia elongata]